MAMTLAQAMAELSSLGISYGWETQVVNLQAFGFNVGETSIRRALEKVLNQIKLQPSGTEITNLSHFASQEAAPGVSEIVAIAVTP